MIMVFCGDNTVASRNAYTTYKSTLQGGDKAFMIVDASNLKEVISAQNTHSSDLFGNAPIFEATNLIPLLRKTYQRKAKEKLRELATSTTITLLDWEEKSTYDLGIDKDKFSFVKEFKLPESTFTVLPTFAPGKKSVCLTKLRALSAHQPIEVTFVMIMRHIRTMIALLHGTHPKITPYMLRLAQTCAQEWEEKKLLKLYRRLLSIEINVKTGRNSPLDMQSQLETVVALAL